MHDAIDSEFYQFGNPLRESASKQVGISLAPCQKPGSAIGLAFAIPATEIAIIGIMMARNRG
jgi:hypothetical protein